MSQITTEEFWEPVDAFKFHRIAKIASSSSQETVTSPKSMGYLTV